MSFRHGRGSVPVQTVSMTQTFAADLASPNAYLDAEGRP